jgi:hypothetical protein
MLSARTIYGEIFDNDEAFGLFCSIAASGEAQGGWENGKIAALVPGSQIRRGRAHRGASARPPAAQARTGVGHHRRALWNAAQHRLARGIEITGDLDAEPVLLERHDGRLQRGLIRQRGETIRDGSRAHC